MVTGLVVASGGAIGLPAAYRFAYARYERLVLAQERLIRVTQRNQLLLSGFTLAPLDDRLESAGRAGEIWFVGHIYPKNGFHSPGRPSYPDEEEPLAFLRAEVRRSAPARVVFGGDNVWSPTAAELEHIAGLKRDIPMARFVLGNHDRYWESTREANAAYAGVFERRSGYEDLNGVRLVYLHTVLESGDYGLDQEQRRLLAEALTGTGYRYALVFMHHAPWAGHTIYTNTPYPNADTLARDWDDRIVPLLRQGRVRAVLAGDGGWRAPGRRFLVGGIPHYLTGWSGNRVDILPEWLSLRLERDDVTVTWHRLFGGEHFVTLERPER
jgi:hypothetical protein